MLCRDDSTSAIKLEFNTSSYRMELHFVEERSRVPEAISRCTYLLMALSLSKTSCNLLHLCSFNPLYSRFLYLTCGCMSHCELPCLLLHIFANANCFCCCCCYLVVSDVSLNNMVLKKCFDLLGFTMFIDHSSHSHFLAFNDWVG